MSSFDNQRRNSYFYTRYYISFYLRWMKSVLRLNKVPFALNFYIFEHTPILDQNCKFIEKPPSAKQNMPSGAHRKLLYLQFFGNLPALYFYQTLEKGFKTWRLWNYRHIEVWRRLEQVMNQIFFYRQSSTKYFCKGKKSSKIGQWQENQIFWSIFDRYLTYCQSFTSGKGDWVIGSCLMFQPNFEIFLFLYFLKS